LFLDLFWRKHRHVGSRCRIAEVLVQFSKEGRLSKHLKTKSTHYLLWL
jgi:hypothetical protein